MSGRTRRFPREICLVCGWGLLVLFASEAFGLVLHPAGTPDGSWTNKPPNSVVGRWRTNASCVAITPNYLLTVRHQGGGIDASVFFDGVEYLVKQIWNEPSTDDSADLRICRIETLSGQPANLQYYAQPYTRTDEVGQEVILGGYGDDRGTTLLTSNGKSYGYVWDQAQGNTVEHWGTNIIDDDSIQSFTKISTGSSGQYVSEFLLADFDDLDVSGTTSFEAIVADHDSGSGLFVQCSNDTSTL